MERKTTEQVLDSSLIRKIFDVEKMNRGGNFLMEWIAFINTSSIIYDGLSFGTPYRTAAPQVFLVEEGDARADFNDKPYMLKKGDLVLKPANTLFTIQSISKDWKMRLIAFKFPQAMQKKTIFLHLDIIRLSDRDYNIIKCYFDMISNCMEEREKLAFSIEHLVLSLLDHINIISTDTFLNRQLRKSRVETLFAAFMQELLENTDVISRDVSHYAGKLKIATNYLGNAVKEASGKSAQYWINSITLHTAQTLLMENTLSIKDITSKLGFTEASSFTRFFKKHTGQTPMEYRNGKGLPKGEAEEKINS